MKSLILLSCFFIFFLSACTQSRYIQKAYAFFQHINYGTIAVDDKGNQLTPGSKTTRFIYLECKGNTKPKISQVIYKGEVYNNLSVMLEKQTPIQIGIKNSDGKKIVLTPAKGNSLWKIEITFNKNNDDEKADMAPVGNIIIKGKKGNRVFTLTINNEIELQPVIGV